MEKLNRKPIEALEKQIEEVEKRIRALIKEAAAALMIRSNTCLIWLPR